MASNVAMRGATVFSALQLSIASYREAEARRRRDGICAVADLQIRLEESRAIEAEAVDAAAALDAENARLRRDLAAARAHAAQMEATIVSYAERNGLI
ncbi:hypothetical protein PUR29_29990 [Methylobacterium ajmalii]|uniref:Uncharacterized protein n=1 Tax=Methylobacterium ajmalii TaxID=2738439 RepID=A0ABV0A4C3_9HYPH|nr:hypothetical protein [Methylobacterium currus]